MTFQEDPKKKLYRLRFSTAGARARPRRADCRAVQRRLSLRRPACQPGRRQARQLDLQASLQPCRRATTPWTSSRRTATAGAPACRGRRLRVAPTEGLARQQRQRRPPGRRGRGRTSRSTTRSGSIARASSRTWICRSSRRQNPNLSVYFIVYATPGTTPKIALEFLKGDTVVARARPDLPAADKDGHIPYVGDVSDRRLRAGSLQRARPGHGGRETWRSRRRRSPSFPDDGTSTTGTRRHRERTELSWDEVRIPFVGSVRSLCLCASVACRAVAASRRRPVHGRHRAVSSRSSAFAPASTWSRSTSSCSIARASRSRG